MYYNDAQDDYVRFKLQIAADSDFTQNLQTFDQTVSQTGWEGQDAETSTAYASGTNAVYVVQTALDNNTTYYWRIYAIDPAGDNVWIQSATRSFTTVATASTTKYWTAGAGTTAWATDANWSGGSAPVSTDTVIIDGNFGYAPVLNVSTSSVTVGALTIGENASSTFTVSGGGATRKLIVTNDAAIGSAGTLTHTGNTTAETNRLYMDVGGNLTIAAGGKINADGKGYAAQKGPGYSGVLCGAAYGGQTTARTDQYLEGTGSTYGSIIAPVNLGSGGWYAGGGGAVILNVTGTASVYGNISALGGNVPSDNAGSGSGGSVYITAGAITG